MSTRIQPFALAMCIFASLATADAGVPVYRFWSPKNSRHFYTISETEKQKLIDYPDNVWTYEGVAYYASGADSEPGLTAIYRFWCAELSSHFFTASETERDKLLDDFYATWAYEGIAWYAYPEATAPAECIPVYRFWSPKSEAHFYTISEAERDKLLGYPNTVWTYEGIAWYAYADETPGSPPDILGRYITGPVTVYSVNCGVLVLDSGELIIDTQEGTNFSGLVTLQGTLGPFQIVATEELTGTVSADGSLSGTYIDTFYVDGVVESGGNGTFTGQFDDGELSLHVSGQDTYGGDCDHTADVTLTRTSGIAWVTEASLY